VATACEVDTGRVVENFKTLIDLRSEKEWNGDLMKYNSTVFDQYDSLIYKVEKSKRTGRPKLYAQTDKQPSASSSSETQPRARHMLSVIDEGIYKRGVFKRLGIRKKLKAAMYVGVGTAAKSSVTFEKGRKIFLDYINNAGHFSLHRSRVLSQIDNEEDISPFNTCVRNYEFETTAAVSMEMTQQRVSQDSHF
jgi:hypothetical protein